jgi:MFS family permease
MRAMASFTRDEIRVVAGTSGIYALRMLGLYMALPVMATWAATLPGSTEFLVGMALGAYGLTQAIFQVPAGWLGDVLGRRFVIIASLLVFALGCAVVATGDTIVHVVVGRLLQGVGAMASTLIALIGDATRPEVRTRAMALMGAVLGASFAGGFLIGPLVAHRWGVPWVFGLAAALTLAGVLLFELAVPARLLPHVVWRKRGAAAAGGGPAAAAGRARWSWSEARALFSNRALLVLDLGIGVLHAAVTGLFVVVPFYLQSFLAPLDLWRVYLPVLAAGVTAMFVSSHVADRASRTRVLLPLGGALLTAGLVVLALAHETLAGTALGLGAFVVGFAMVEPLLASLVTHAVGPEARGTAAGVFNMVQFGGAFVGGALAGALKPVGGAAPCLAFAALTLAWTALALMSGARLAPAAPASEAPALREPA